MSDDRHNVVIVGGGLAGLAAAECLTRLHPRRFRVQLLEARRVAGGRAGSFADRVSGESIDYCQHVAMGCCTNLIELLDRSGQLHHWTRLNELTFLHPAVPPSRFAPSTWLPAPLHLLGALRQLKYLSPENRRQIKRGLWRLMRTPSQELHSARAKDWLVAHGQDESTIQVFWEVILVSALGEALHRVSMAAARHVIIDGFAAARGASDVLVPNRPLAQLFGESLVEYVTTSGTQFCSSQCVTRIHRNTLTGAVQCVETSRGERVAADSVILATPWTATSRLLQASGLSASFPHVDTWRDMPSSPITGLHLWLDRPIMPDAQVALVGLLPQWLFRRPVETRDARNEYYYQVVISASHHQRRIAASDLNEHVMSDLARVLPSASQAIVLRSQRVTDPQAVFSISPEVDALRPTSATPIEGLYLAGDWTQTGWPATMESAVISGQLAASQLLTSNALTAPPCPTSQPRNWLARLLIHPHKSHQS